MSLSINNKTIKSLIKDGKEIVKVERVADGKILYELDASHSYALSVIASNDIIQSGNTTTLTATLTDNGNPAAGESIVFKKGSTVLDTVTTDSNGEAEYEYTGTGAGDVTITVLYNNLQEIYEIEDCNFYSDDGTGLTGNYSTNVGYVSNIQSDTYIDITFPQFWEMSFEFYRPSTVSNRALLFSIGQDSNNCKLVGYNTNSTSSEKDLQIYNRSSGSNSNCQKTTTPDYNNEEWTSAKITFNGSKIIFKVGSTVLKCNDNYATNIFKIYSNTYSYLKNIKVKALPSYNLSVTASDNVIQSGNTTTLTATLKDGDVALTGETLSYEIKHGQTTINTGIDTTDNNGEITITYTGTGAGDIEVIVSYGSLLQEIFVIEDCWNISLTEQSITNSSGTKITSIGLDTIHNVQNDDFVLEFDGKGNGVLNIGSKTNWSQSTANYRATIGADSSQSYYSLRTTRTSEGYYSSSDLNTYYHYKIVKEEHNINYYVDNQLMATKSESFFANYDAWSIYSIMWGSGTQTIKNIRIKAL